MHSLEYIIFSIVTVNYSGRSTYIGFQNVLMLELRDLFSNYGRSRQCQHFETVRVSVTLKSP